MKFRDALLAEIFVVLESRGLTASDLSESQPFLAMLLGDSPDVGNLDGICAELDLDPYMLARAASARMKGAQS